MTPHKYNRMTELTRSSKAMSRTYKTLTRNSPLQCKLTRASAHRIPGTSRSYRQSQGRLNSSTLRAAKRFGCIKDAQGVYWVVRSNGVGDATSFLLREVGTIVYNTSSLLSESTTAGLTELQGVPALLCSRVSGWASVLSNDPLTSHKAWSISHPPNRYAGNIQDNARLVSPVE